MPAKRPRRTADRIVDTALALFNRFGEANVPTSHLCGELGISPGNLFYHHPTRAALVAALLERYRNALAQRPDADGPQADAPWWLALDAALHPLAAYGEHLARTARAHRFLFRDLSDLVSRHRVLEQGLPPLLRAQGQALAGLLPPLPWQTPPDDATVQMWCGPMLASLTGCMGLEGALDPREHLRGSDVQAVERALALALALIGPALQEPLRSQVHTHLRQGGRLGPDPWWLGNAGG